VRLFREALRTAGIRTDVAVASDGEEALNRLREVPFDLMILDLNLPKGDGLAVLRECAKRADSPPIVVFSGSDRQSDRN